MIIKKKKTRRDSAYVGHPFEQIGRKWASDYNKEKGLMSESEKSRIKYRENREEILKRNKENLKLRMQKDPEKVKAQRKLYGGGGSSRLKTKAREKVRSDLIADLEMTLQQLYEQVHRLIENHTKLLKLAEIVYDIDSR